MPKRRPRTKDFRHALDEQGGREAVHDDLTADRQKFGKRSKFHQQNKTLRTATGRMADVELAAERKKLPVGEVIQVYSLFADVHPRDEAVARSAVDRTGSPMYLCTARRTMRKLIAEELGEMVVGDLVRFAPTGGTTRLPGGESEQYQLEGVIESVLPRKSILTRVDSFEDHKQDPIVANADQFLIVASMHNPFPRFGLIDRMLVAAQAGKLTPAIVINKADLAAEAEDAPGTMAALEHYRTLSIPALLTSTVSGEGLEELRRLLAGRVTVLAGHSGVGKSSLLTAIEPTLDLRVAEVSASHQKGRHTTTSARRYALAGGGAVVDTPGVKVFGLWNVDPESLIDYFPDVAAGTAPPWRVESFERIRESLGVEDDVKG
jgi:ribosome biogenesis GTPase